MKSKRIPAVVIVGVSLAVSSSGRRESSAFFYLPYGP
jgi:hypothetical protein